MRAWGNKQHSPFKPSLSAASDGLDIVTTITRAPLRHSCSHYWPWILGARHYLGPSSLSLRLDIRASPHDSPFNGRPRIRHCLAASSRHHPTRPLPLTISHAALGSVPQSIFALTDAAYPPVPPSRGVSPAGRRSGLERPVGHLLGTRAQTRLHARRPVSQGPARHSDRPLVTSSAQLVRPHATFLVVGCA
ncbi:hypothetical protein CDEST_13110 [Colletotrichum destructivum]|uniref:Uncharacterized protein n=1 Tax=Colletotrichum destructivum TaxID=34406 RepID=A0AAX4IY47_9PEZI|nr:hypothetical protein CDEST_13110 [Colletotrichum destructivum]